MKKEIIKATESAIIEQLVINGNLTGLNQQQKVEYYKGYCERLGLDPFTQPFKILRLQGKETLYCDRSGVQQLSKLHNVSHDITSREQMEGIYLVTCKASADGRHTESIGAVTTGTLSGDALCNALMKAETKAKRRATLDLLGLGMLDESEVDTIPNAKKVTLKEVVDEVQQMPEPATKFKPKKVDNPAKNSDVIVFSENVIANISQDVSNITLLSDLSDLYSSMTDDMQKDAEIKALFTDRKKAIVTPV